MAGERRTRGYLTSDINALLKQVMSGEIEVVDRDRLTPKTVGLLLVDSDQLDPEDKPSDGAIRSIFERWKLIGYATTAANPYRFEDFTEQGKLKGLEEMDKIHREKLGELSDEEKAAIRDKRKRAAALRLINKAIRAEELAQTSAELDALSNNVKPSPDILDIFG